MKMPFGKEHKDKELDTLPNSYLQWIIRTIKIDPPLTVHPERREQYRKTRVLLRSEAHRILRERALNRVYVQDPKRPVAGRTR